MSKGVETNHLENARASSFNIEPVVQNLVVRSAADRCRFRKFAHMENSTSHKFFMCVWPFFVCVCVWCCHISSVNVVEWFVYLRSVEYLFGNTLNIICPLVVLFSVLKVCSCVLCDLCTEYQNLIYFCPFVILVPA